MAFKSVCFPFVSVLAAISLSATYKRILQAGLCAFMDHFAENRGWGCFCFMAIVHIRLFFFNYRHVCLLVGWFVVYNFDHVYQFLHMTSKYYFKQLCSFMFLLRLRIEFILKMEIHNQVELTNYDSTYFQRSFNLQFQSLFLNRIWGLDTLRK